MKRRVLDVSSLGSTCFGPRDPLWWGVMLLIAIEGTMLVLLAIAYFYISDRTLPFPPTHMSERVAWIATADMACWLIACIPQHLASRAAIRADLRGMRLHLLLGTVFALLGLACRFWLFGELPFRWDSHAYGSVVWGLLVTHFLHALTGMGEDALYVVLTFIGPIEDKHRVDIEVSSPMVYFVAAGSVLVWAIVFLEILVAGR
jgi:cytochrome c oxidase subunit 3